MILTFVFLNLNKIKKLLKNKKINTYIFNLKSFLDTIYARRTHRFENCPIEIERYQNQMHYRLNANCQ